MMGQAEALNTEGETLLTEVPKQPSLRAVAARGSAVTLASQALRMIVVLGSTIVLARLISPADYGALAMVVAVTGVAEIFRDFGLSMAAIQSKSLSQHQKSNLFWLNAAIGLALTVIVFCLSWPIAGFYRQPELAPVIQMIAPIYFIGAMGAQFRVDIIRSLRFGSLAYSEVIPPILAFVAALVLALNGFGVVALVAQQLVLAFATLLLLVIVARWWPGLPRRGQEMGQFLRFGFNYLGVQLLAYATRNIDSVAIGRVWGPAALGYYDRAFQISVMPLYQINAPMSRTAIPILSRISDDRERYLATLRQAQLVACYVTASLLFLVAGLGAPVVAVLLGPEWSPAAPILSVLAVGSVFRAINQITHWMFMSQGLAGSALRFNLIGQPMIIALILVGLPWGPMGVAIGSTIGYAIYWAAGLLWAGRASQLNVRPLMGDALRIVLFFGAPAGIVAFAVATFVAVAPWLQLVIGGVGACAWYAICWLVSRQTRRDSALLFGFARIALSRG